MNKKVNTLLFLSLVLPQNVNPGLAQGAFILLFILAVIASFFVYHRIMKILAAKIDLDTYFEPIFPKRKNR